ncbi:hypothetical protein Lal_00040321 [Lupinus albus]|uniref:Uncharacterized protein n=1 Tax=Lupinus albus TaxID=3870 RepID=A0A6A5N5G9_LUPAL|nr:hypothetical protein Lalb_Chr02g0158191 [Lupinus albus]KAF1877605.1 hypothetical protein Lal_00040321 [Lupinus albus]
MNQSNSSSAEKITSQPLRLITAESFIMERGPKYKAYAELRETRLRIKHQQEEEEEEKPKVLTTPPRKQVKFQGNLVSMRKGSSSCSSILAQSVPDFTAALRKENKKPVTNNNNNTLLPSLMEMTPPMKSFSNNNNGLLLLSGSRGSKSANAIREKKKGSIFICRKSYASVEELKSLSSATTNAINGEGRGGRNRVVMGKSVSGNYRQF